MSVTRLHCPRCGTDFIDARVELRQGDDVMCPACHALKTVTAGETIDGRVETPADIPVRLHHEDKRD